MIHRRIVAPTLASEHITLAAAKEHLRVTDSADDALIQSLISEVRQMGEDITSRAWCTSTWVAVLDEFLCDGIRLPAPPVVSVTSVQYVDESGVSQTLATPLWQLDSDSEPGYLFPAYGTTWPTTRPQANAVRITCTCGYPVGSLPESLRRWMLLHIGHAYEHREATGDHRLAELPYTRGLLDSYRIFTL